MNRPTDLFLNLVCARLRERRPLLDGGEDFASRTERVADGPFVSLWFRTRGCRHDARGGCTMCNYGASSQVSEDEMVRFVREGLSSLRLPPDAMLLLSPSGSMFDDWEVPAPARSRIFSLAAQERFRSIVCESRLETLSAPKLLEYRQAFADREAGVGVGVESADAWVTRHCINKDLALDSFGPTMALLADQRLVSTANVLLGPPFLSENEAVADAVRSVHWVLSAGAEQCVLFPAHVKRFTLTEWLWRRGRYSPPSLWALVEALAAIEPELIDRVTISWYKEYESSPRSRGEGVFLSSPSTCPECEPQVLQLLDEFRAGGGAASIERLMDLGCTCRDQWRRNIERPEPEWLSSRLTTAYEEIGKAVLGEDWWRRNGAEVLAAVPRKRTIS